MTRNEVLQCLCYYDRRNPIGVQDEETITDHEERLLNSHDTCACGNCVYKRTPMAEEMLALMGENERLKHALKLNINF